jgi:hypothetical protein
MSLEQHKVSGEENGYLLPLYSVKFQLTKQQSKNTVNLAFGSARNYSFDIKAFKDKHTIGRVGHGLRGS